MTTSGQYSHECTKKDCYYCYYMRWLDYNESKIIKTKWEPYEDEYLLKNYQVVPTKELTRVLKRSINAIWSRVHHLKNEVAA